jgi:hypothetical protein
MNIPEAINTELDRRKLLSLIAFGVSLADIPIVSISECCRADMVEAGNNLLCKACGEFCDGAEKI